MMLVLYALPFGLMFVYKYTKGEERFDYNYSYGPTGFKVGNENLLLFCGLCFNPEQIGSFWSIFGEIYIIPLGLLVFHGIMACKVYQQTKVFVEN